MFVINYQDIVRYINQLRKTTSNFVIGKSVLGQPIYCFVIGDQGDNILLQAGMHAREYIGSLFLLREIELLKTIRLHNTFIIVPLVNPDGVRISLDGIDWIKDQEIVALQKSFEQDPRLYKANARGVDLNVNFDAGWGEGLYNRTSPFPHGYIGCYPNSEPENKALISLINSKNPVSVISYHAKGEVVYFGFKMSKNMAKKFQNSIKHVIIDNRYRIVKSKGSAGGLSDYCVMRGMFAFTVEVGRDVLSHPLPIAEISKIMSDNVMLPLRLDRKSYG